MKAILFNLVFGFTWILTLLPLRLLYPFSDLIYLILYYIIGYRKKVVLNNLRNSFPERSGEWIHKTSKKFYRHFADLFVEMAYSIHMGKEESLRRFHFTNPEIIRPYYEREQSIIILAAHYGNWEWPNIMPKLIDHQVLGVYKPLQNKSINRFWLKIRGRFGSICVPMDATLRTIITYQRKKKPAALYLPADQRPQYDSIHNWSSFLNQDAPVITGPEKLSRKFRLPVVFLNIKKLKRGYYSGTFQVICDDPAGIPKDHITIKYLENLENMIRKRPELWLWSHKRWKYHRYEVKNPVEIAR